MTRRRGPAAKPPRRGPRRRSPARQGRVEAAGSRRHRQPPSRTGELEAGAGGSGDNKKEGGVILPLPVRAAPLRRVRGDGGRCGGSATRPRAPEPQRPAGVDAARAGRPRPPRGQQRRRRRRRQQQQHRRRRLRNAGSPPTSGRSPAPSSGVSVPSPRPAPAALRLTCR